MFYNITLWMKGEVFSLHFWTISAGYRASLCACRNSWCTLRYNATSTPQGIIWFTNFDKSLSIDFWTGLKLIKLVTLKIVWLILIWLADSNKTASYKMWSCLYFTLNMSSSTVVSGFKLLFKFRAKGRSDGVDVELDNGSVIVIWEVRCTSRPKSIWLD